MTSFDLARNVVPNFHHKEKTMTGIPSLGTLLLVITLVVGGCQFLQSGKLLAAPTGADASAARHNEEGIDTYKKGQWITLRLRFKARPRLLKRITIWVWCSSDGRRRRSPPALDESGQSGAREQRHLEFASIQ